MKMPAEDAVFRRRGPVANVVRRPPPWPEGATNEVHGQNALPRSRKWRASCSRQGRPDEEITFRAGRSGEPGSRRVPRAASARRASG